LLPVSEKKILPHFFSITSVGKKLILKNHLTPAPTFSFEVMLKYQGMILGKFESGARPGTW
jgi:hypothetical protein